jgi:pyrroline-5-carboxylate reductase
MARKNRESMVGSRKSKGGATAHRVAFIGAGNMATALVQGFIDAGLYEPREICASDVDAAKRGGMKRRWGVSTTSDNVTMVKGARVIVLAVKPQIIDVVLTELRPVVRRDHVFVSIAAGVPTRRLEDGLGSRARVVRVMPNTPALLGQGMAVAVRGRFATASDERLTLKLLRAVGKARAVADERLLDAVTGLSGSGPAYVYLFAEALIAGGCAAGLKVELAEQLALQTIAGAAAMLQQAGETPQRLREMVTSPGGTTLAGLTELDRRGFTKAVSAAVVVATRRSKELGRS